LAMGKAAHCHWPMNSLYDHEVGLIIHDKFKV
jgi:hypothetical protein